MKRIIALALLLAPAIALPASAQTATAVAGIRRLCQHEFAHPFLGTGPSRIENHWRWSRRFPESA
jgi:hypothetical protein